MDILCICRICLNESNLNLVSIYDLFDSNIIDDKKTQISCILDEFTGNKYNSNDYPYPDKICELCLNDLKAAIEFKHRCDIAFEHLLKVSEVSNQLNVFQTSPDDNKPLFIETPLNINNVANLVYNTSNQPFKSVPVPKDQDTTKSQIIFEHTERTHSILQPKKKKKDKVNEPKELIKVDLKQPENLSKTYQCFDCRKTFSRATHLRRHNLIHTDERAFACKLCDKKFRRADHLKIHENYHSKFKPHSCQHCQKTFSRSEHLRRHITSRHTQKTAAISCEKCEFVAETTKELNKHKKSHNDVQFTCKICDKTFKTKPEHTEHLKVHNDERPFLCSECGMRFIRNDYLVVHMRRHRGEKPYKCKYCERAFPRATDLNVHERYHTNEKKHTCSLCGKGFHRKHNLTVHYRVHTKEKPYQCPHCSRSFSQSNDLKAHIRRHTGERFQCEFCEASFIQIYLLNNHKKNVHAISAKSNISRVAKFDSTGRDESPVSQIEAFEHETSAAGFDGYTENEY